MYIAGKQLRLKAAPKNVTAAKQDPARPIVIKLYHYY